MNSSTRGLPFVLALLGACAPLPDAPAADADAGPASPDVSSPAPVDAGAPPSPDTSPSRAMFPSLSPTQPLPSSPQLHGTRPDLVSGGTSRVDGALWISFNYRPTVARVTTLRGRVLDADDELIESLPTELDALPRSPQYGHGVVQLLLPATPARSRAQHIEITVVDVRGVASVTLRMPVSDATTRADGEPCSRDGIFNICHEGSACSPAGRCATLTAPTLRSATAFASSTPSRSALTLRWSDPNQDVTAVELTLPGHREPLVLPVTDPGPDAPWSQRWDRDVFEGATRASVRLRDDSGRVSDALDVAVSPPTPVAAGDTCDATGTTSRCGEGLACTRDNGFSCGETRCVPDVTACSREVPTTTLDTAASTEGPWTTTGSMTGVGEVRASVCDRYVGRAIIHRFRAPAAGTYDFALAADNDTWTTRLIARTRCSLGDVDAQEASTSRGSRRVSIPMTLRPDQEVFLFVTTEDRFTLTATRRTP